jgi:hypothetical protein
MTSHSPGLNAAQADGGVALRVILPFAMPQDQAARLSRLARD